MPGIAEFYLIQQKSRLWTKPLERFGIVLLECAGQEGQRENQD